MAKTEKEVLEVLRKVQELALEGWHIHTEHRINVVTHASLGTTRFIATDTTWFKYGSPILPEEMGGWDEKPKDAA